MAQAGNKNIDNASGQVVRLDIQNTVKAVATHNFGSRNSAGTILPCEFLADDDTNKLLIRKSTGGDQANPTLANGNANPDAADFFTVGDLNTENLGLLPKSGGTLTGNLQLPNGTSSAPSLNLGVEEDENGNTVPVLGTGLYRSAVNTLAFTSGGSLKMILNNTATQLVGTDTAGAKLRFREKNGQGNNFVQFKCPGTLTSNVLLTLPSNLGSTANDTDNLNGLRVLKTNSSGELSFQSVDANDLAGTVLKSTVVSSSLTSVGTLGSLNVTGACTSGTFVGNGSALTNINRPAFYMRVPRASNNTDELSIPFSDNSTINNTVIVNYQENDLGFNDGEDKANGRFTVPTGKGGLYVIFAGVLMIGFSDKKDLKLFIVKNGTFMQPLADVNASGDSMNVGTNIMRLMNLSAGDIIQAGVSHNNSTAKTLQGLNCFFGGFRLSAN